MQDVAKLRKIVERLVKRGTWVDGFNAGRLKLDDGTISDYVRVGDTYVWIFFWKNARYTSQEFAFHIEQQYIADWRRRLHS